MLKIGITGGIGSGKTTVCKIFEVLGLRVYYADEEAKTLINEDLEIRNRIIDLLGSGSYLNGVYNVSYVKSLVFKDSELLNSLNKIVHPAVASRFIKWSNIHSSEPYILKEAAIMNKHSGLDAIIYVRASEQLRLERVMKRDLNRSLEEVKKVFSKQKSDADFLSIADYIIENENELPIPQVLEIHKALLARTTS